MRQIPVPQEIYRHFKGNLYQIVTLAEHSETGEQLVVYQALYGDFKIYARPLLMFMGKLDKEKYPEANQKYRLERVAPDQDKIVPIAKGVSSDESPVFTETPHMDEGARFHKSGEKEEAGETGLDPLVAEFLDASSCEERLNILSALHHRITGEMINIMSIALDIELKPGDIEEQYVEFRNCLTLMERFESNRLR